MRIEPGSLDVGRHRRLVTGAGASAGSFDQRQPHRRVEPSRALVPVARPAEPFVALRRLFIRAFAPFIAHLHAVEQDAPQTRARRRAEPSAAIVAYEAAAILRAPNLAGAIVERVV